MKNYIEIVRDKTGVVVNRLDVTGKSERSIERCEGGIHINMNHDEFHTRVREYDHEMPKSDEPLEVQK
ncbi:MAG: hypothetical protein BWY38_02952 [Ignavibacteria bacterium ADurb.Bin266]|jgi:hypothetical protein|nr:MAG: hypothetical protein BWY38_02952 [Ignavibacteria bacterium ADurb.Bin266]